MRLHFGAKPWDLYAAIGYTAVVSLILLLLGVGTLLAIILVIFLPGYVLTAAVFPGLVDRNSSETEWIGRIALASALSVATVSFLGLLLNLTPWGISLASVVTVIALFTVGTGAMAFWRRMRLPADQRLSATVDLSLKAWRAYGRLDRVLAIALALTIILAAAAVVYIVLNPRSGERFTEFYLLGSGGNFGSYPTALNVSEAGSVILGISNHEAADVEYSVRVDLVGVRLDYNPRLSINETIDLNRTSLSWLNVTLNNNQNWTQAYTFRINTTGLWKVQFLLFKGPVFAIFYRELHFLVRVPRS